MINEQDHRAAARKNIEALSIAIAVRSIPLMLEPLLSTTLSIQQLKALSLIVTEEKGSTGAALAKTFGVTMASISNLVDRLVAAGLATRSTDPDDLRVKRVQGTELGREVVRGMMAARPELRIEVLSRLSIEELDALELGMRALSRELRAEND